jgi:L-asparaginase II
MESRPSGPGGLAPLATVTRSGFVEGVHHGSAVTLTGDGGVHSVLGTPDEPVLPRSSLKLAQAVAMVRSGLDLDGELLALACASHSGEQFHRDGVLRILARAGLDEDALGNTPDLPIGEAERRAWQRRDEPRSRLAQNCSGKHAAMLATCRLNGWPAAGYWRADHPLQQVIEATVADLAGEPVAATVVDGCGAPAFAISLTGLARSFGRIAAAAEGTPEARVAGAVRAHPEWVGGTGREVTGLLRAVPGLIAKDGAEAVYAAALPDGRAVALKITDGSDRARQVVMAALLLRLGAGDDDAGADGEIEGSLREMATRPVLGHGEPVGTIGPAFASSQSGHSSWESVAPAPVERATYWPV